jgi:ABC-type nitrate/sulfonate/bicarbonate transport system substrate-binding protein
MKRSTGASLAILLVLLFVGFHALVSGNARAQEKIRIGISSTSPGFLPTMVAEQKGFFPSMALRRSTSEYLWLWR